MKNIDGKEKNRSKSRHSKHDFDNHSIGNSRKDTHYSTKKHGFEKLPKDFGNFELDFLHIDKHDMMQRQEDILDSWGKSNLKSKPRAIQLKKKNSSIDRHRSSIDKHRLRDSKLEKMRDYSRNRQNQGHSRDKQRNHSNYSREIVGHMKRNSIDKHHKHSNF